MATLSYQGFSFLSLAQVIWSLYCLYVCVQPVPSDGDKAVHGLPSTNLIQLVLLLNVGFMLLALYSSYEAPRVFRPSDVSFRQRFINTLYGQGQTKIEKGEAEPAKTEPSTRLRAT